MKGVEDIFELQAELCKTIANPRRLEILNALRDGEKRVGDLVAILGVAKANVSQHLAFMRHKGIVRTRKEGVYIYYSLANPRILKACSIMKEVLREQMRNKGRLFKGATKRELFL
jgi:ArsR family transcriptional regulator